MHVMKSNTLAISLDIGNQNSCGTWRSWLDGTAGPLHTATDSYGNTAFSSYVVITVDENAKIDMYNILYPVDNRDAIEIPGFKYVIGRERLTEVNAAFKAGLRGSLISLAEVNGGVVYVIRVKNDQLSDMQQAFKTAKTDAGSSGQRSTRNAVQKATAAAAAAPKRGEPKKRTVDDAGYALLTLHPNEVMQYVLSDILEAIQTASRSDHTPEVHICVTVPIGFANQIVGAILRIVKEVASRIWPRTVVHCTVMEEPHAAYLSVITDMASQELKNSMKWVAFIVDIGHGTLDLAFITGTRDGNNNITSVALHSFCCMNAGLAQTLVFKEIGDERLVNAGFGLASLTLNEADKMKRKFMEVYGRGGGTSISAVFPPRFRKLGNLATAVVDKVIVLEDLVANMKPSNTKLEQTLKDFIKKTSEDLHKFDGDKILMMVGGGIRGFGVAEIIKNAFAVHVMACNMFTLDSNHVSLGALRHLTSVLERADEPSAEAYEATEPAGEDAEAAETVKPASEAAAPASETVESKKAAGADKPSGSSVAVAAAPSAAVAGPSAVAAVPSAAIAGASAAGTHIFVSRSLNTDIYLVYIKTTQAETREHLLLLFEGGTPLPSSMLCGEVLQVDDVKDDGKGGSYMNLQLFECASGTRGDKKRLTEVEAKLDGMHRRYHTQATSQSKVNDDDVFTLKASMRINRENVRVLTLNMEMGGEVSTVELALETRPVQ